MFQTGDLVRTRKGLSQPFSDDPYVQCFPGNFTKEDWKKEPHRIYICETVDEGLIGQIVDIVEVGPLPHERPTYLLAKIITAVDGHPRSFWVFIEEVELLEE